MKVEHHGPAVPDTRTEQTGRAGETGATAAKTTGPAAGPSGDTVRISDDVQFVRSALERANAQPEIRPEVVQRMRELIERGELGADAEKLADALIDRWLTES